MEKTPQNTPSRLHHIDAIRVLAFGLLILYHVGMFYVADWGWHIKSQYQSHTLQLLMELVNRWRMPLLFLVSGMASWFLLRKLGAASFTRSRVVRLLLPLLFGMLVVVPPQAYLEAVSNGATEDDYWSFLRNYFSFLPWPEGAFAGSAFGITWNHLWYLPYLLFYTLLLIPAALWLQRHESAIGQCLGKIGSTGLILLPLVPMLVYYTTLYPRYGDTNHALFEDWYAHALFGTFFIYGYLLAGNSALWQTLARMRHTLLWLAPFCVVLLHTMEAVIPESSSPYRRLLFAAVFYLNRWCWVLAILAWSQQLLNRPFRWLPYANEAVYPWYILHQTIIVVAGFQLAKWSLGPVLESALVLIATVGGCLLLHEYAIRRTPWLRPLFGLKPSKARAAQLPVAQRETSSSA